MSLVLFGAARSCGVTTLVAALAATWPEGRQVLVVELDPAGGTLAAASGWPAEPGLLSLAAAARRGAGPELVWEHCQALPGGAAILAGPTSAAQAASALAALSDLMGRFCELDADVLVDVGRVGAGPLVLPLVSTARPVVLVSRPQLPDLSALANATSSLRTASELGLALVGDGPYRDDEISDALGVPVLGRLPWDPAAAAMLTSVPASARSLRVAPLVRAARSLADRLGSGASGPPAERSGLVTATGPPRLRPRAWRSRPALSGANGSSPDGGSS